ncbi:MAG: HepT-like ribonuclease domain-containing protein [Acetobacteraceae bacterium]
MIDAAESAQRFIAGRKRADIDTDEQLRFALVHALQIIGEAAARLSSETRSAIPSAPWSAIIFMRNRLVHAYFDIGHDVVWKTVIEDLPPLLSLLRGISLTGAD